MADIKSPEQRSVNMSHIRGVNTKPEEYIRKLLYARGYRYRKNYKGLEGKPDIWISKYRIAIFVHGCFWHRHKGCKYAYMPKSRIEFWNNKFRQNMQRDEFVQMKLLDAEVRIIIVWECTIRKMNKCIDYERKIMDEIDRFMNMKKHLIEL